MLGIFYAKKINGKIDEITPNDIAKGKENDILKVLSEIQKVFS